MLRAVGLAALVVVVLGSGLALAAQCRSPNFLVNTSDARLAQQICQAAEKYRHDLAISWLGKPMPNWSAPCVMTVRVGPNLGAGGATTFIFDRGEVFGWRMNIQGSVERIFDSVLPHEITHMIFASHFREPLPRWADEGGATNVEHPSEKAKHRRMLVQFLHTGRGIAFNQMFAMRDYPSDVMPLYAQAFSLADYLIQVGGRRKYVEFLGDGLKTGDWSGAVKRHYGISDLGTLQNTWLAWVKQGFPAVGTPEPSPAGGSSPEMLAQGNRLPRPAPNLIHHIRGQDPAASSARASAGAHAGAPGRVPAGAAPNPARGGSSIYARLAAAHQQRAAAPQQRAAAPQQQAAAHQTPVVGPAGWQSAGPRGFAVQPLQTPGSAATRRKLTPVRPAVAVAPAGETPAVRPASGLVVLPASGWRPAGASAASVPASLAGGTADSSAVGERSSGVPGCAGGVCKTGPCAQGTCGAAGACPKGVCAGGVCPTGGCAPGVCAGGVCSPSGPCAGGACPSGCAVPGVLAVPGLGPGVHTQVTHPQPIEPPRQTVLEWSRTPGTILR